MDVLIPTEHLSTLFSDSGFPETLYCFVDDKGLEHGLADTDCGGWLAVFASKDEAEQYGKPFIDMGLTKHQVSFDEAREVASNKFPPLQGLLLLRDGDPLLHYIR